MPGVPAGPPHPGVCPRFVLAANAALPAGQAACPRPALIAWGPAAVRWVPPNCSRECGFGGDSSPRPPALCIAAAQDLLAARTPKGWLRVLWYALRNDRESGVCAEDLHIYMLARCVQVVSGVCRWCLVCADRVFRILLQLSMLDWPRAGRTVALHHPTYSTHSHTPTHATHLTHPPTHPWPPRSFLLQLSMLDWPLSVLPPSRLAAGVLSAALSAFGKQPWCPALAQSMLASEQVRMATACVLGLGVCACLAGLWPWAGTPEVGLGSASAGAVHCIGACRRVRTAVALSAHQIRFTHTSDPLRTHTQSTSHPHPIHCTPTPRISLLTLVLLCRRWQTHASA